jgi:hypothetical protein
LLAAVKRLASIILDVLSSRTLHIVVFTVFLITIFVFCAAGVSLAAYFTFYSWYLPDQIVNVPLHLQYGFVFYLPFLRHECLRVAATDTRPTRSLSFP